MIRTVEYYWAIKGDDDDTGYNMHEPWKHCAKWTKPVTTEHISSDSISMKFMWNIQDRLLYRVVA